MQNKFVISESQKLFLLKESTKEKIDSKLEKSMDLRLSKMLRMRLVENIKIKILGQ